MRLNLADFIKILWEMSFNMFHVFAFIYYILLCCVTREYSMTSVTTKNYSIYATREYTITYDEKYSIYTTREYITIFDLHDAYYSLLERYMKHVFVAGLVTGDFLKDHIMHSQPFKSNRNRRLHARGLKTHPYHEKLHNMYQVFYPRRETTELRFLSAGSCSTSDLFPTCLWTIAVDTNCVILSTSVY